MTHHAHEDARVGLRSTFRPLLDDRGRPIRRLDRADLVRAARSDNPGLAMLAARLRIAIKSECRRNTPDRVILMIALVLGVLFTYGVIGSIAASTMGVRGAGVGLLILIGLIVAANRLYSWYVRRGALGQIARTAVAEGVCGSCAFSLEGAVTDPDARVVCPECGAAWRRDRIVSPFWEKPAFPVLRWSLAAWLTPGSRGKGSLYAPDDRGRYIQSPDSRLLMVRPELLAELDPNERAALRRSMRRVGRWWRVLLMLGMTWMPGGLLFLCWTLYSEGERGAVWVMLGITAPILLGVLSIPLGSAFGGPHRTARVIVAHARCGSCLHPLHDTQADQEGRRVCDRCGAAWLTPEGTPPAP
jgi:hypothetical protein